MAIDLHDRTIVITGASSGIGRATAIACAQAGMHCVVAARRAERLEALQKEIEQFGRTCTVVVGDATDGDSNTRLLAAAKDPWAVFANAGRGLDSHVAACDLDDFRALFEINLFAAVDLVSKAAAGMVERGGGHLLMCSSCLAKFSVPGNAAYTASKASQDHVCKAMAMELRGTGVHVSSVHPIGTRTEFFHRADGAPTIGDRATRPPSWLMQPPQRVARGVIRCLRRPRPEVWTSMSMRAISTLLGASPRLARLALGLRRPPGGRECH